MEVALSEGHTIPAGRLEYWGKPDEQREIAPGVVWISTPSHGGIVLSDECNATMPDYMRRADAIYEEDCNWCLPVIALDLGSELAETLNQRGERVMRDAKAAFHRWHPEKEEQYVNLIART
jgi:Domain of unknown function (DUF7007)